MHFSSPKMVCETKIVADEHDAIPGSKKESMMWSSPASSAALNPAEAKDARKDAVFIREFERGDQQEVRRIFYEGIMERIPNTAFRGLRQQPRTQLLYAFLTGKCPLSLRTAPHGSILPAFPGKCGPAVGVKSVAASRRQHVTKGMAGAHGARVGWDRRGG